MSNITHTAETRLILLMAPSFQGGHSTTGDEVAEYLGIPFPLKMEHLSKAARARGFDPAELWPWHAKMIADRKAMAAQMAKEEADAK
ncbi:MAG: hypothetical protein JWP29_1996 [Rhodoferax sp.]|nr:hypothetical protein [Rhodoferax sp.]